jgi:protein-tyrosine phosphatase
MPMDRTVGWDGFHNARDLGGLPTRDGRRTRRGAFYRSAMLGLVTDRGWQEAREAGVRTVVDLRNDDEVAADDARPVGITHVRVRLDGVEDVDLWEHLRREGLDGTPMYFLPFLARRPDRVAAAMTTLARSEPGIVFHCSAGRDRTGLITLLLLALADVEPDAVAEDYGLSVEPLRALSALVGRPDDSAEVEGFLTARGTTATAAVLATLEELDVATYLRDAGVAAADVLVLRRRLLD